MSTTELERQRKIFSNNLKRYLESYGKTQLDLSRYIGVSTATVSDWCNGKKMPRMDKIQAISDWMHIQKSDLLDEEQEGDGYYINPETAQAAQEIFENKELRLLFDAARDASPEDLMTAYNVILALKKKEQGN